MPRPWLLSDRRAMVALEDIRQGVRALGLVGRPLCVHASLRSFGRLVGGAADVIDGLLAEGCTVMVATHSSEYAVAPTPGMRPEQNGVCYEPYTRPTPGTGRIFTPESDEMDREWMGAVPAALIDRPGRVRGDHPLDSFTAVGPLAEALIAGQTPLDIFAPVEALARAGGWVVLMGVGLDRMTLLHLAEYRAGRNPFIRWANGRDGRPGPVAMGGCSDGFEALAPALAPLLRETRVSESLWRAYPAAETVVAAARAIWRRPRITHCGQPTCQRCDDAVLGGPILSEEYGAAVARPLDLAVLLAE
jgi:aminoglycoside N3'-acetyltransferase